MRALDKKTQGVQLKEVDSKHRLVFDGVDKHGAKHFYKCEKCGASDWIASYGEEYQLNFIDTPCVQLEAV
jgi:hypothetical protein